jgi:hypothetical protein
MRICPDCSLELPDGIPTCPDCEIPMIDPDEEPDDFEPEAGQYRFVQVRLVKSRLFAEMLLEAYRNENIPCKLQSEDVGIMLGNYGTTNFFPVRVLVPACYLNRASRIARRIHGPS